jgi:hypothetical protein
LTCHNGGRLGHPTHANRRPTAATRGLAPVLPAPAQARQRMEPPVDARPLWFPGFPADRLAAAGSPGSTAQVHL